MGGLTGFSSLAEGYMRLDESGIGAPSKSFLETPDDGGSHPFLRAYGPPSSNVKELPEGNNQASSLKTSEEQDMAYFERRYQERIRKDKLDYTHPEAVPVWSDPMGVAVRVRRLPSSYNDVLFFASCRGSCAGVLCLQSTAVRRHRERSESPCALQYFTLPSTGQIGTTAPEPRQEAKKRTTLYEDGRRRTVTPIGRNRDRPWLQKEREQKRLSKDPKHPRNQRP
ncbi:unnamed protein product [Ranitomeya imitator]|uniref:Uncharacterized protein n=1 Tax=Ranitomeya imitator TaxID=111125 RepID=A0ABN9MHR5_9NEOB|nr:unnamed protein product [Ranitomeya imitator]